ncbi:hypothetical protein Q3G72_031163 [Acer saccharum]|nr:hypothetical protein Q3G72_031163 [Acer saccharum]
MPIALNFIRHNYTKEAKSVMSVAKSSIITTTLLSSFSYRFYLSLNTYTILKRSGRGGFLLGRLKKEDEEAGLNLLPEKDKREGASSGISFSKVQVGRDKRGAVDSGQVPRRQNWMQKSSRCIRREMTEIGRKQRWSNITTLNIAGRHSRFIFVTTTS